MRTSWLFLSLTFHGAVLGTAAFAMHQGASRQRLRPPQVELQSSVASPAAAPEEPPVEPPPVLAEETPTEVHVLEPAELPLQAPAAAAAPVATDWPVPETPREPLGRQVVVQRTPPAALSAPVEAVSPPPLPVPPPPAAAPPSVEVAARPLAANAAPEYPARDRALGNEGTVVVAVRIDAQGVVAEATLLEPSPHPGLNRAALRAVLAWRFAPATLAGAPVEGRLDVPVVFRLQDR